VRSFQALSHLKSGIALDRQAIADLNNSPNLQEKAIAEYREAIRLKPDLAPAHQRLGEILHEQGKLTEALAAYRQAIHHDPEFIDPHVKLGVLLEKQGRFDEAITFYREAIRLDPDHPFSGGYDREWIYYSLGQALAKRGNDSEAVDAYVTGIRIAPNCPRNSVCTSIYKDLEPILKKQGKPGQPISKSIEAIVIHPQAKKYIEIGRFRQELARFYYIKAIRFDPQNAQDRIDLGEALSAASSGLEDELKRQQILEEVIAEYREAIYLDPNNAEAHTRLGNILEIQGKLDEAISEYREVIRINSNKESVAMAHRQLGITLYKQGKNKEAVAHLKEARNAYKYLGDDSSTLAGIWTGEIKQIDKILQEIK
jgi:tetratricopeptide (TPR) repeat protein